MKEAGAVLAGGHSINDEEPKYGMSVTGFVHPEKVWKNYGAKPGDLMILTKPLGTGLVNTAVKADMASKRAMEEARNSMTALNKTAKEVFSDFPVHCCTDVTGFSLAGHGLEIARASNVTLEVWAKQLPVLWEALDYAAMGLVPEGTYRNKNFQKHEVKLGEDISEAMEDLIFDPQTSGGLLVCLGETDAREALKVLQDRGLATATIVGQVKEKGEDFLEVCSR